MARIVITETDGDIVDRIFNEIHRYGMRHYGELPGGIQLTRKQFIELKMNKKYMMYVNPHKPFEFDRLPIFISDNPNNAKDLKCL